jgi:amidase
MQKTALRTRDRLNAFLDYPDEPVPSAESGLLAGLRLGVKDIFDVANYPTGCGNPAKLAEARPALHTMPAVRKLLEAGARFIGKTQTDELAFSMMGINAHFPPPVNPAAPDRVVGGSSCGSAAAVAGGLADIAVGSDTAGSIRAPASFCGLMGLRTTYGRIPLKGAMPLAPSFDTFGWFTADIEAYEAVGRLLLSSDPRHGILSRPITLARYDALVLGKEEEKAYEHGVALVELSTRETELESPFQFTVDELYWCQRRLQAREAWDIHGPWLTAKPRGLGPQVKERFEFGATVDDGMVRAEDARRAAFRAELAEMLGKDGFMVLPTVPGAAPLKNASYDAMQAFRERALKLCCLASLSGFPQITLPICQVHGAPFGISLLGPAGSDIQLIRLGRRIMETAQKEAG